LGATLLKDVLHERPVHHFRRDLRDLYDYYLDDAQRERLARMGRVRQAFTLSWWFLRGLVMKLPPARRLLLLLAFFFMLQGDIAFRGERFLLDIKMSIVSFLMMLIILMLELKDKLVAKDELAVGRAVQLALMPSENPALGGWDIWLTTRPANDVGGDLVDYLSLPDGRLALALGDVSGKGLGAALLMAKLQSTLRAYATDLTGLDELGRRVNAIFCRDGLSGKFATLLYLEVAPDSGAVRLLNAGHMPPLLLGPDSLAKTPPGSLPLGILPEADYREVAVDVPPGSTLILYSDGLTEAFNAQEEFFGEERLHALLQKLAGVSAEAAGKRIIREVDTFLEGERPEDDFSLAVLRRLSPEESSRRADRPAAEPPSDPVPESAPSA
jgi:hypothetical protein